MLRIQPVELSSPQLRALVDAHLDELMKMYGEPHGGGDLDGDFLVATLNEQAAGCAGLRYSADTFAEVQHLYVAAAHRRNGVGRQLMQQLELVAARRGYSWLRLVTGSKQPEAERLYEALGWSRIEPYGKWSDDPGARFFGKELSQA